MNIAYCIPIFAIRNFSQCHIVYLRGIIQKIGASITSGGTDMLTSRSRSAYMYGLRQFSKVMIIRAMTPSPARPRIGYGRRRHLVRWAVQSAKSSLASFGVKVPSSGAVAQYRYRYHGRHMQKQYCPRTSVQKHEGIANGIQDFAGQIVGSRDQRRIAPFTLLLGRYKPWRCS